MTLTPVRARIESAISFVREGKGGFKDASKATRVTLDVVKRECRALGIAEPPKPKATRGKTLCARCLTELPHPGARARQHFTGYLCKPCLGNHMRAMRNAKGRTV